MEDKRKEKQKGKIHNLFTVPNVPNIGELMLASFVVDQSFDAAQWYSYLDAFCFAN